MKPNSLPIYLFLGFLYGIPGLALIIQIYRYHAVYTRVERQQTKWAVFGILAWIAVMGLSSIPYYYILNLPAGEPLPWWQPLGHAFWSLSLSILPASFTLAILRSHLWNIDVLIRRTLLYSLLTGAFSVIYFGAVTVLQSFFTAIIGHQSTAAIVISTLAIAALFNPLRRRMQGFIDRRFYRQKYDAERALAEFAASARSETDLEQLTNRLTSTVQDTLQPEHTSLWLRVQQRSGGDIK